jgi:SecD/SecF fusion protein
MVRILFNDNGGTMMSRQNGIKLFVTVILIAAVLYFSIAPLQSIPLGLDLRGGVHLVLQATPEEGGAAVTAADLSSSREVIERRINELGVSEPHIEIDSAKQRLIIEIAGVTNPDDAVRTLRTTAKLTFRDSNGVVKLEGSHLKTAVPQYDQQNGGNVVAFTLDTEGAETFRQVTAEMIGQQLGVYLDEELITNPTVNSVISGGSGVITGYATIEEAREHALLFRSGALPVSFEIIERRQVGALLGADSLVRSLNACLVAIALILAFVILIYRLPGLVAAFAIIVFSIIVLWLLKLIGAVLTLPGIAGFVLSIGMAVDLNIIIYERLKEELRAGKSPRAAVDAAFSRAFITVFDSNITTLFAAGTLFFLGTSMIKGFALILGIGIITSLFTAVTFSRMVMRWVVGMNPRMNKSFFAVKIASIREEKKDDPGKDAGKVRRRGAQDAGIAATAETYEDVKASRSWYFNIVSRRKTWYIIAAVLCAVSIISLAVQGLNLDIDFTGGTMIDLRFSESVSQTEISAALEEVGTSGTVQLTEEGGETLALIRVPELSEELRETLLNVLEEKVGAFDRANVQEDTVGPAIGAELRSSAIRSIIVAAILMLAYIAIRFRFNYAFAAVFTLFQDVLIVAGAFSLFQWQVDSTFIAAVLTVFGYDINDTVVIYDRIRENEKRMKRKDSLPDMIDKSVWQTMSRSINTTLAMMLALIPILLIGGESTRIFAVAMIIGVCYGAYSSIFLSSQLVLELTSFFKGKKDGVERAV